MEDIPSNSTNPEATEPKSKTQDIPANETQNIPVNKTQETSTNETQSDSTTEESNSNQNNTKTDSSTNSTQKTETDRTPSVLWKKLTESIKPDTNSTDSAKLMKLGGFESIHGLRKVSEPTQTQKLKLKNYLLKWENAIDKIYKHLNYISALIKQNQEEVNTTYFEIATALLLLVILILGFRVVAFIFDNSQNYKKLPMEAKQERIEEESRQAHSRNLYVASNLQLVIFALLSLCSFAIVKMFPFVSCIVFSAIIFYMIFTAILKVFKEGKQLGNSVNSKRIIISFVSAIVGIGYALGYSKSQDVLCFGLIILVSSTIIGKKKNFCSIKNIICLLICLGIIIIHITYNNVISSKNSQNPNIVQKILKSNLMTYIGLAWVTIISYLMIKVMRKTGTSMKPIFTNIFILK